MHPGIVYMLVGFLAVTILSEKIKQIRGMSGIWQQAMARAEKQNNSLNYTRFSERVIGLELALKVLEEK